MAALIVGTILAVVAPPAVQASAPPLAAPLPRPVLANQCERCEGPYAFRDRPTDMAKMAEAFNTVLVRTYDPDAVTRARAAGLAVILEFDDKDAWVAGQDISSRLTWIASFVMSNPGTVSGVWVADQLNKGTLNPDQQLGYLRATGGFLHAEVPGVPVFADVSSWELTCGQPGQASCASLVSSSWRYQTNAVLNVLRDSGYLDGFFLADNLTGNSAAASLRAYTSARALWPSPFKIISRTSHLSFPEAVFPGSDAEAATLVEAYVNAPLAGGIDGMDLWAWHRPWTNESGANELRTFLNKDFTDNALWRRMASARTRWAVGGTTPGTAGPAPQGRGYWMVDAAGAVYAFGSSRWMGNAPVGATAAVDVEPSPSGSGYWVVDAAGRVFAFGDASYLGGSPVLPVGETVTSLSALPQGGGYWLFTSRGRSLPFGAAAHLGDMGGKKLNSPVLDSIATPSGRGYYMVAGDGGIFAFGDARFYGSMGRVRLNAPVQSLVPDPDGVGYWLVASDGGIFSFETKFYGSMGSARLNRPITGMVGSGRGYLMVAEDGGIFAFGDAPFLGSLGDRPPARPVASVAALG